MSTWKERQLDEVIEKFIDYRGKTPKKVSAGIPLITAKVIKDGTILAPDEFIEPNEYSLWMTRGLPKANDVLLTTEAPLGEVALLKEEHVALAQRIILLRGNPSLVDNGFLFYSLRTRLMQHRLGARASGSTVQGIKAAELKKVLIPLPDVDTQKVIVKTLSCLDRKIENLRRQNETLEAIAQTLFKHWFVDFEFPYDFAQGKPNADGKPYKSSGGEMVPSELGEIPVGWRVGEIEDLFNFLEGPGIRNWQYTETGTRFINIRLIQNGDIEVENANCISNEEANGKYNHFHLKPQDFVVSTSGTLGRCAIVREEHLPLILNTSVIRFRPKKQNDYEFMYQLFQSKYFTHNLKSLASGSVQLNFGPMHLRQIKIFIPTRQVLDEFSTTARSVYQKYTLNFRQIQTLTKTRDVLLPKLMSGKLRIKD